MKNSEVLELIFKSKKSIEKIQNTKKDKTQIKKLAEEIIYLIDKMNDETSIELKNLEDYWNRLNEIEKDVTKENTITIRNIIKSNLPKDILCKEDDNKLNLYVRKIIPPKRKEDDIEVGLVDINGEDIDKISVNVRLFMEGNRREESFNINKDTPLRIYKIISYIHDNLSYDE